MVDYEQSLKIYTDVYGDSTSFDTVTQQMPAKPTITSFEPVSMETSIDAYDELTVVSILVPTGVASVITDYDADYDGDDYAPIVETWIEDNQEYVDGLTS